MMLRASILRNSLIRLVLLKSQFHSSSRALAVQPFLMPAMSPTMDKGDIVEWAVKVGEPFSTGDVLLNVETDKAQIDVEAQDDGKVVKILEIDGAKDIPVGKTIAFIADIDDDISSIKIPDINESVPEKSAEANIPESKVTTEDKKILPVFNVTKASKLKADDNQTFYPSVLLELERNGISKKEALENIEPTGRNGRILKGDVLAYLGKITKNSVEKISSFIEKFEKLDLTNIEIKTLEVPQEETKGTTESSTKTIPPKEEAILSENIVFNVKPNVDYERVRESLRSYIGSAYHKAHRESLANTNSEFYDNIFESLLSQDETKARFKVNFELIKVETEESFDQANSNDIFNLLSNNNNKNNKNNNNYNNPTTSNITNTKTTTTPTEDEYIVSLNIKLEEKYSDALPRAELFINLIKNLQL